VIIAAECEAPPPAGICDACAADFDIDIGGSQPGGCITATSLGPGDPGVDYDLDTYQAVATNVGTIQSFSTIFATTAAMSAAMVPGFSGVVPNDAVGIRCGWVHDSGDPGNPLTNYAELAIKLPGSAMELLSASMLSVVDDTLQLVITSNVDGTYDINTYHGFTSVPLLNVTRDFTAKDPIHWRVNGATNHFCNLSPCRSAPVNQSGTN
jgi:hypothetical protein